MLELTIPLNFPLPDDDKYIDVVVAIAKQCDGAVMETPISVKFDFYCANKCEHPHVVSADGHKRVVGALVACGIIPGFRWKYITGFADTFHIDATDPRLVVRIV